MTTVINLVKEPILFDTVNKTLSAEWVDWYAAGNLVDSNKAVSEGHEKLRVLLAIFPMVTDGGSVTMKTQLAALQTDIRMYIKTLDFFEEVNEKGYYGYIKDDTPSFFTSDAKYAPHIRLWLVKFMDEHELPPQSLRALSAFVVNSAVAIKPEDLDLKGPMPELVSSIQGLPSLKWVIHTHYREGVAIDEAHHMGCHLLACNKPFIA